MNHILPQEDISNPRGEIVLSAMVDLFYSYLKKAQQPTDEAYSWVWHTLLLTYTLILNPLLKQIFNYFL